MKSFSSTLNRGGATLSQTSTAASSNADVLRNAFNKALNDAAGGASTGANLDIEGINYNSQYDVEEFLNNLDISVRQTARENHIDMNNDTPLTKRFENGINMGDEVFAVADRYRSYFKKVMPVLIGRAITDEKDQKITNTAVVSMVGTPSLFNPYYAVEALGIIDPIPLRETDTGARQAAGNAIDGTDGSANAANGNITKDANAYDCSIKNLVELSKNKESRLGNATYKYADFMYCKDLGKVSNNHMITLRRYATPIGDNIFSTKRDGNNRNNANACQLGDIGRMITWFGTEDNKLEDIMHYSFHAEFQEFKSDIQSIDSAEDEDHRVLNIMANMMNPEYPEAIAKGYANAPFGNSWPQKDYKGNNPGVPNATWDTYNIYEPKDTMRSTHIYTGNLIFSHEFTLNFSYKLRSYDNINPKSAFLDLIANVLATTYRNGRFWGGERRIHGMQRSDAGWKQIAKLLDAAGNDASKIIASLSGLQSKADINAFLSKVSEGLKSSETIKNIGELADAAMENIKKAMSNPSGMISTLGGIAKSALGRPKLYAFHTLLQGGDVGLWHVTIGNPLNPIAAFGNLIIDDVKISHTGPLGFDDFPSELKVAVSLKHAIPRDASDISHMYTAGREPIYTPLTPEWHLKQDNVTNNGPEFGWGAAGEVHSVQHNFDEIR